MQGTLAEMTGTYRTYMDPVSMPPKYRSKKVVKKRCIQQGVQKKPTVYKYNLSERYLQMEAIELTFTLTSFTLLIGPFE